MISRPARKYDKGEKRLKHEGRGNLPEIQFSKGSPKVFVGLCPANMPSQIRQTLLDEAIAAPRGDRDIGYDKYFYAVHEGAIYEARTSDAGTSYHGFPYRGKLSTKILGELRDMADKKGCLAQFDQWVKKHIVK